MSIDLKDYSSMFKLSIKPKKLKETEKPNSLFTLAMIENIIVQMTSFCFLSGCGLPKEKYIGSVH